MIIRIDEIKSPFSKKYQFLECSRKTFLILQICQTERNFIALPMRRPTNRLGLMSKNRKRETADQQRLVAANFLSMSVGLQGGCGTGSSPVFSKNQSIDKDAISRYREIAADGVDFVPAESPMRGAAKNANRVQNFVPPNRKILDSRIVQAVGTTKMQNTAKAH
ncbi:MAG: hypothetical protein HQL44_09925 [Alphaproteobacteria bacterium]|nr:hypothetical protein [Alphaproteobacteria bacterium]